MAETGSRARSLRIAWPRAVRSAALPAVSASGAAAADGPEAGTTLVELLVALALLSLIALFIGEGIGSLRSMAPVARRIDAGSDVALVRDHLRQTIGEALAGLPGDEGAPFEGLPQRLAFLAPGDPFLEVGGVSEIVISLEPGSDGLDLVETRRVHRITGRQPEARTVLLSGLRSAGFAYAPPVTGEAPDWRSDWSEAGRPPALVRLDLTPRDAARAGAPLVVHPGNSAMPRRPAPSGPPAAPSPAGSAAPGAG